MADKKIKLAVVGTGVMGRNHARTIFNHPEAELRYVIDANKDAAQAVATQYGGVQVTTLDALDRDIVDGIIIATPSHTHVDIAADMLGRGIDVLVEKPIALEVEDAEALSALAKETGRELMVGHIELFNPAVTSLEAAVGASVIRRIVAERLGYVNDSTRLYHNVIEDLMVHDLAIVMRILDDQTPNVLHAFGRQDTVASPDPADAHLVFDPSGVDVRLSASRAFMGGKKRSLTVETDDGLLSADLIDKTVTLTRAGEGAFDMNGQRFLQDSSQHRLVPPSGEPLIAELSHFLNCIRGIATTADAHVSADHAIRVLKITKEILNNITG